MIYTLDGELHLQDVPTPLLHKLIRELTVPNPKAFRINGRIRSIVSTSISGSNTTSCSKKNFE